MSGCSSVKGGHVHDVRAGYNTGYETELGLQEKLKWVKLFWNHYSDFKKLNSALDYWLSFHWDLLLSDIIVPWVQTPWIHCCPGPCRTACTCLWEKHRRTLVSTVSRSRCGPGSWGCCTSHTAPPWNFYLTWRNNKLRYSTKTILFV